MGAAVQRNVGGRDRQARATLAVVALAVAAWAVTAGRGDVATVGALAGIGLGVNAVTGVCGLNALLGVDTCGDDC